MNLLNEDWKEIIIENRTDNSLVAIISLNDIQTFDNYQVRLIPNKERVSFEDFCDEFGD